MILNKLKHILRPKVNIMKTFERFDSRKNGLLSGLQFRQALRKMGLWLSSNELD